MSWQYLGKGSFNLAFHDPNQGVVLKVKLKKVNQAASTFDAEDELDLPERSIRLWNEINPDIPPPAQLVSHGLLGSRHYDYKAKRYYTVKNGIGWTCPFIKGRNSSQTEICNSLIDIFNKTGRVVLDAIVPGNFQTITEGPHTGKVVCIDIGLSLKLQNTEHERASIVSEKAWHEMAKDTYLPWFAEWKDDPNSRDTIITVKALYALQLNYPIITNADFLRTAANLGLRNALANEIDNPGSFLKDKENVAKLKAIQEEAVRDLPPEAIANFVVDDSAASLEPLLDKSTTEKDKEISKEMSSGESQKVKIPYLWKEVIIKQLENYISSRGTYSVDGQFEPALSTKIFRNIELTKTKVDHAKELIEKINDIGTIDDALDYISKSLQNPKSPQFFQATIRSGLKKCLDTCKNILEQSENMPRHLTPVI